MKIFVVGASGQAAKALVERGPTFSAEVTAAGRPQLDLADRASLFAAVRRAAPDIVIDVGAYTAVDQAETEEAAAHALNAEGPGFLAEATVAVEAPLIHLSTDYVFDGAKGAPYVEDDAPSPLGVYGRTKLEGERAVMANNPRSLILRTAWVYSPFGRNFLKTMLRLAETRDVVNVVADQIGAPTYALDIADGILALAPKLLEVDAPAGVRHMTAAGEASWADFAEVVLATSGALGGPHAIVNRIATADYPMPAARPANSRLDCSLLKKDFGVALPDWRVGVADCVKRVLKAS